MLQMTSEYYTINNVLVKEVTLRLASYLISLPIGSWPETQQATVQLAEAIPDGLTMEQILEFAARHERNIHPTWMEWLKKLARNYSISDQGKAYPALVAQARTALLLAELEK